MEVVKQVNIVAAGELIPAVGMVMFWVIIQDALAIQPFVPVTVTVYVPGDVTTNVAAVPTTAVPLDQE
jgi:hypothetical protein